MLAYFIVALAGSSLASITVQDPSDYVDLTSDADSNAIKADYNITPTLYQVNAIEGPYYFNATDENLSHQTFEVADNDTSVIVITEDSQVNISYSTIVKYGYGSNLFQESFYGLNAAINIANGSTSYISNTNITVKDGAANIFAYGGDTVVYVDATSLYSAGPVSHGLYAAGNATIYGSNIQHYSGGNRASSFSGDNPAGYIHVRDSIAHTAGIGSAIFYALGEVYGTNVIGHTEKAPILFSDGYQHAFFNNCDFTSDFLAGTVMFSSADRQSGAYLLFNQSRLTTTAEDQPALWFGNVIATADIIDTEINAASGILLLANRSQVTQEFDYFAGYEENSAIAPAIVTVNIQESNLVGDIVAYNESSISWSLSEYTSWVGSVKVGSGAGSFGIALDDTSTWTLTADAVLQNFTNTNTSLANINSNGFSISYVSNSTANAWLNGSTYSLNGGGSLKPYAG